MKYVEDYENIPGKEWPVRPYYKRELAEAYAPTIHRHPHSTACPNG